MEWGKGFPGGSASTCQAGDSGLIPGSGRSPGEGNGYPLQYSGLENRMDGGGWQATVHEVGKSQTQLSDQTAAAVGEETDCAPWSPRLPENHKTDTWAFGPRPCHLKRRVYVLWKKKKSSQCVTGNCRDSLARWIQVNLQPELLIMSWAQSNPSYNSSWAQQQPPIHPEMEKAPVDRARTESLHPKDLNLISVRAHNSSHDQKSQGF